MLCCSSERAKVFKLSFEYLHMYSPKSADFAEISSRIASLMSCQKSDLWKTLKTLLSTAKTTGVRYTIFECVIDKVAKKPQRIALIYRR